MAGNKDGLYFEVGVEDKIAEALKKDIELSEELSGSFKKLVAEYSKLDGDKNRVMDKDRRREVDSLVKSSDKYLGILERIKIMREKINNLRVRSVDFGIDTKALDEALYKLNSWNAVYQKTAKTTGTGSAALALKTGKQFQERAKWIEEVIRGYNKLIAAEEKEGSTAAKHGEFVQMQWDAQEMIAQQQHMKELERLKAAMIRRSDEEAAAQQRNSARQRLNNQARQESVRTLRQQVEATVKSRLEMLKAQQAAMRNTLSKNAGILDPETLKQSRNALKQVSSEILVLEGVMQNMKSYSSAVLGGFVNGNSNGIAPQIQATNKAVEQSILKQKEAAETARILKTENNSMSASYNKVTQSMRQNMSTLSMLRQQFGYYFSLFGAQTLLQNVVTIGGQFEYQHVALQNIIGDVEKATVMFAQLKELAIESPMTFLDLTTAAKQLSAYQTPVNELYDTTRRLSDLSVGLGVDINRLILAFGQVRAAAVLRGQELRQFTEAGIPIVQALADKFTEMNGELVTTGDVFKLISQRAVSFEMVKEILWDMTNEGGRFYNMQAEMADTLYGKWQKLADIWQITLGDMADMNIMGLKPFHILVDGLVAAARNLQTIVPVLMGVAAGKGFGLLRSSTGTLFGMGGIDDSIKKAQRLRAIELVRLHINGEIGEAEFNQRMQLNEQKSSYYALLAAEGKINDRKIAQLAIEGQINKELAQRILLAKGYTEEQVKQALLNNGSGLKGAMSTIGNSVLSFFGGWTGLAVTGVTAVITGIFSWIDSTRQKAEEAAARMNDSIRQVQEKLKSINEIQNSSTMSQESEDNVRKMSEWLKENAASWDMINESMVNNDGTAKSLTERYNILKDAIESVRQATAASGDGVNPFEDTNAGQNASEGIKKYQNAYTDFKNTLSKEMRTNYGQMLEEMKYILSKPMAEDFAKEIVENGIEGNLYEQMMLIQRYQKVRDELYGRQRDNYGALTGWAKELNEAWLDVTRMSRTAYERLDELDEELKQRLRERFGDAVDFESLTDAQREYIIKLYNDWLQKNNVTSDAVVKDLNDKFLNRRYNIELRFVTSDSPVLSAWGEQLWSRFGGNLTPSDGKVQIGEKAFTKEEFSTTFSDINTFIDEYNDLIKKAEKTAENYKKAGNEDLSKEEYERARILRSVLNAIGPGLIEEDSDSSSTADNLLKLWKERFSELKAFYSEYKKWAKLVGKNEALKKIQEDGLFSGMFKDGKPILDISAWKNVLDAFLEGISGGSVERDRLITEVRKEISLFDYDQAKEDADRYVSVMKESMSRIASQWDTYKNLYEKTGDRNFAELVFGDGKEWDEKSLDLKNRLMELMKQNSLTEGQGLSFNWDLDEQSAKEYYTENFKNGEALYEQWKQIVDMIRNNYKNSLNEIATAQEGLMTTADKIRKIEQEIADLRNKGVSENDPRIIQKEKRKKELQSKQFEEGTDYLRFYSAILSMTSDEADRIGAAIKENLVDQLADGKINADKYLKSMKNIDQQLSKARNGIYGNGDLGTFLSGGQQGLVEKRYSELAEAALKVQEVDEKLQEARLSGNKTEIQNQEINLAMAKHNLEVVQNNLNISTSQLKTIQSIADVSQIVMGSLDGMQKVAQSISEMLESTGHQNAADTWSDIADGIGIVTDTLKPIDGILQSIMSGNLSGAISNAILAPVNLFTAPITGLAKLHDKKLDRAIEKSTQKVKVLQAAYTDMENELERRLGGIYGGSEYNSMLSNYKQQLSELQKQRELEERKKNTDKDKLFDYDEQINQLRETVKYFAEDMAKDLYDIDIKSWAQNLTDAVVDAWSAGEDAAQAWHDKVQDLVQDVTKNVISQKIIETALEPVLDYVTKQMTAKEGKLEENDIIQMAKLLDKAGETSVVTITSLLDAMEAAGYEMRDSDATSSNGLTASVQSLTEETGNLLVSYVNAIRADVSVSREILTQLASAFGDTSGLNTTAQAQLRQLEMIASNTKRGADNNGEILEIMNKIVQGTYSVTVS